MEPYVIEGSVQADGSAVGDCVELDNENSTEQRMDISSYDTFITPRTRRKDGIPESDLAVTGLSRYSVDSGFSDQTFDSTWTSSLSLQSSCELDCENGRRLTLKAIEFSPINRGSDSNIMGRRLKFGSFDLRPLPFDLSQSETAVNRTAESSEEYLNNGETDSLCLTSVPHTTVSDYNDESGNCSSSPCSVITDDLEVSLQDMALEKSSLSSIGSRASPVQFNYGCLRCHRSEEKESRQLCFAGKEIKVPQFVESCRISQTDTFTEQPFLLESKPTVPYKFICSSFRKSRSSDCLDNVTNYYKTDAKLEFSQESSLNSLSSDICEKQTSTSSQNRFQNSVSDHSSMCEIFQGNKIISKCFSSPSLSNCMFHSHNYTSPQNVVHNYTSPQNVVHNYTSPQNVMKSFCNLDFAVRSIVDNCRNFTQTAPTKNLYKSHSKRLNHCDEDCDVIFSPSKLRKMEIIPNTYKEDKMTVTVESPRKNIPRKMQIKNVDFSPVDGSNCEMPSTETSEKINKIYNEELAKNVVFMPQLCAEDNSSLVQKEITSTDSVNIMEENVRRLVEKFSPPQPTRLIGRNVGVKVFDIVYCLYSQNLHPCLRKLFQYVSDADLLSVARVSTSWKLALYNECMAYNRFRQYSRNLLKSHLQQGTGKENSREKPVGGPSSRSLTQPRSFLSSMQSQAIKLVVPAPPPAIPVKDTLLSDDVLRICPHCQGPAIIKHHQDRATCTNEKCSYDFCTLCFASFHHPQLCKPLCKAPSRGDVAGTRKSKKNLKRL